MTSERIQAYIGIVAVVLCLLSAVGLAIVILHGVNHLAARQETIMDNQAAMRRAIEVKAGDRWRGEDQRQFVDELRRLNPDLNLPNN